MHVTCIQLLPYHCVHVVVEESADCHQILQQDYWRVPQLWTSMCTLLTILFMYSLLPPPPSQYQVLLQVEGEFLSETQLYIQHYTSHHGKVGLAQADRLPQLFVCVTHSFQIKMYLIFVWTL